MPNHIKSCHTIPKHKFWAHMNHTAISLRRISSCATLRVWNEFTGATFSSDNDDIWPNRRYSDLLCNKLRINIHKTQVWSFMIKCTSFWLSKSKCIISFFLHLNKSSKIGPQNVLSVGARTFFWLLVKNEFDLSPPSDCEESHLLVTVRTKDSCWSESQFYFFKCHPRLLWWPELSSGSNINTNKYG